MIVLAGLIKHNRATKLKKVPFVSNIPIIGLLFRSKSNPTPDFDQEMIISLVPHILVENRNDTVQEKPLKQKSILSDRHDYSENKTFVFSTSIPEGMDQYFKDVQEKISQAVVYPSEAKERNLEGVVKVGMLILNDGTLAYALVKESSGYEAFDEDALRVAKESAPFNKFPSGVNSPELNIVVPIEYKIN